MAGDSAPALLRESRRAAPSNQPADKRGRIHKHKLAALAWLGYGASQILGALYFPLISPALGPWLTRSLLYWDQVATIVPDSWADTPELLGADTLELVKEGLLQQAFPASAFGARDQFDAWLLGLEGPEVDARRSRLTAGDVTRIHYDKWLEHGSGLNAAIRLGLARRGASGRWILVEPTTANEFMATLALSLCEEGGFSAFDTTKQSERWVPVTDDRAALSALLGGLEQRSLNSPTGLRTRGEERVRDLRGFILETALPAPLDAATPEAIGRFRRKHGARLPELRRRVERQLDRLSTIGDEVSVFRELERTADEIDALVVEAERYLSESGFRRVARLPFVRVLRGIPAVGRPVDAAVSFAEDSAPTRGIESNPLAYLAFARAEFLPRSTSPPLPLALHPLPGAQTILSDSPPWRRILR